VSFGNRVYKTVSLWESANTVFSNATQPTATVHTS